MKFFAGILTGALFLVAPLPSQDPLAADPRLEQGELRWFLLDETKTDVARALGLPRMVSGFGSDFESWQYQFSGSDEDEFSHQLVFRESLGKLVSVTRNYVPERSVDVLFPASETTVYSYPSREDPQYSVRLRRLSGGRVLMASGTSRAGQATGQLVLMRESELRYFYPWLFQQLGGERPRQ